MIRTPLRRRRCVASATAVAIAALFLSLFRPTGGETPVIEEGGPATAPTSRTSPARQIVVTTDPEPSRSPARTRTETIEGARADFDTTIAQLVGLGLELVETMERKDDARARVIDARARQVLDFVANTFTDAGEKSLGRTADLPATDATTEQTVRRRVLQRVLLDDLERRFRVSEKGGPRAGLDALVGAMVMLVPKDAAAAEMLGEQMLVDRPFLGPAHEEAVLSVLDASRTEAWLTPVATDLLRTLWRNLETTGARSRTDIASLALLFFEDTNPAHRAAALHELLREPRLRRLVVDRALHAGDSAFAAQVGAVAAAELDPVTALGVVHELHAIGGSRMLGASVTVGAKSPEAVRRAYEEALGDGRDPAFRADLLIAGTLGNEAESCELARIAFREDPDPTVRERALMALTAFPDAAVGERALMETLDDPALGRDPVVVNWTVAGLENLATVGAANAVERIGGRLASHPLLGQAERERVRAIMARMGVLEGR